MPSSAPRPSRPAGVAAILIAACAAAGAGAAPASAAHSTFTVRGGPTQSVDACGVARRAVVLDVGTRSTVVVRRAGASRRKAVSVSVARCVDGRFTAARRTRTKRTVKLDTSAPTVFRVRLGRRTGYVKVGTGSPPAGVVRVPVSFRVQNRNDVPALPCQADDATYTLRGTLVAPRAMLDGGTAKSVTVYTHGHGGSQNIWSASAVPGYDYAAEMAELGHASIIYDRLGYETSDRTDGHRICWGSDATMAHQILQQARTGTYSATGRDPVAFSRVGLGGYSQGAFVNEITAAYFPQDIDALMHLSFNAAPNPPFLASFVDDVAKCVSHTGTDKADLQSGSFDGYALRLEGEKAFNESLFYDADPRITHEQFEHNNPDPCGYPESVAATITSNAGHDGTIKVPVLLVFGQKDSNFLSPAFDIQKAEFASSSKITAVNMPNTGSAVMLERTAPQFRGLADRWLKENGL